MTRGREADEVADPGLIARHRDVRVWRASARPAPARPAPARRSGRAAARANRPSTGGRGAPGLPREVERCRGVRRGTPAQELSPATRPRWRRGRRVRCRDGALPRPARWDADRHGHGTVARARTGRRRGARPAPPGRQTTHGHATPRATRRCAPGSGASPGSRHARDGHAGRCDAADPCPNDRPLASAIERGAAPRRSEVARHGRADVASPSAA